MTEISKDKSVGSIVVEYPQCREVLEEMKIDYCCGGKASLAEAAQKAGVDVNKVIEKINQEVEKEAEQERNWSEMSLSELSDEIESIHHSYMRRALPRLEGLFEKVIQAHGEKHGEMLKAIQQRFLSLKTDIEAHLLKEEQVLFPFIRDVESAEQSGKSLPETLCGSVGNPIRQMEHEHDDAGRLLSEMRQLSGDYTCPGDACESFKALFDGLIEMEKDLHQHIHLENNLLFPKAIKKEHEICGSR